MGLHEEDARGGRTKPGLLSPENNVANTLALVLSSVMSERRFEVAVQRDEAMEN